MDELNKKMLEFAGFELKPTIMSWRTMDWPDYSWHTPSGEVLDESMLPDFPHDLNACMKRLVPLLIKLEPKVWMSLSQVSIVSFAAMLKANTDDKLIGWAVENDPALALCKAIERMVDNGS